MESDGLTVHLDLHDAALLSHVVARCAFVHASALLGQVLQSHDLRIFQVWCFFPHTYMSKERGGVRDDDDKAIHGYMCNKYRLREGVMSTHAYSTSVYVCAQRQTHTDTHTHKHVCVCVCVCVRACV